MLLRFRQTKRDVSAFFVVLCAIIACLSWLFTAKEISKLHGRGRILKKDVVLSFALGYEALQFRKFVLPLRKHFSGDVILWVDESVDSAVIELAQEYSVKLKVYERSTGTNMIFDRFKVYQIECRKYAGYCLAADFRDSFFQRNPFDQTYDYDIILSAESSSISIGICPFNSRWIKECYGTEVLQRLYNSTIICAGTVLANAKGFELLTKTMFAHADRYGAHCNDQGVLNAAYYTGAFSNRAIVQKQGLGVINTVGHLASDDVEARITSGVYLNDDGQIPALVHQYDRFPKLEELVDRLIS